jgi:hypothetical protein
MNERSFTNGQFSASCGGSWFRCQKTADPLKRFRVDQPGFELVSGAHLATLLKELGN